MDPESPEKFQFRIFIIYENIMKCFENMIILIGLFPFALKIPKITL